MGKNTSSTPEQDENVPTVEDVIESISNMRVHMQRASANSATTGFSPEGYERLCSAEGDAVVAEAAKTIFPTH